MAGFNKKELFNDPSWKQNPDAFIVLKTQYALMRGMAHGITLGMSVMASMDRDKVIALANKTEDELIGLAADISNCGRADEFPTLEEIANEGDEWLEELFPVNEDDWNVANSTEG